MRLKHLTLSALLLCSPLVVLAQEVRDPEAGVTATAEGPAPSITLEDVKQVDITPLREALAHKKGGKYGLAAVALLIFLTQLLLRFGPKIPGKVGVWLKSPIVTWLAPQVLSVAGALLTALGTGSTVDVDLILDAVLLGLAGGGFGAKLRSKVLPEEEVKTVDQAVDVINSKKGPPPA